MRPAANQPGDQPRASQRLTVQEAAEVLGVTVDAVRGRIKRGTLTSIKGEAGTVYVLLEEGVDGDQSPGESQLSNDEQHDQSQLVERMASEIEFLRGELQRKDAILLSMTEGLKSLEAPTEPQEAPVSSSEEPDKETTPPPEQQTPSEQRKRSWWRGFFGLE